MSIPSVVHDVTLFGSQIFDHAPLVHAEIDRFVDRFERNERRKEFDGILRASHALEEATETPVEALFDAGKMQNLIGLTNALAERIRRLTKPTYKKEHDDYKAEIERSQKAYVDLCRTEAQKKMKNAATANRV